MLPSVVAVALFATFPPQLKLSTQEDHKRMLAALNIKELRRGADGNNKSAPNAANTDESKANPYTTLPDPLVFDDGMPVKTPADWTKRRAEIVEHFDREVYGRVSKVTPKVTWEVTETTKDMVGTVAVTTKKLVGRVDNSAYPRISVNIQLSLTTPTDAKGPVPVVMEFGFGAGFGGGGGNPWTKQVIDRGWGYAIIQPGSIQADSGGSAASSGGSTELADSAFDRLVKSYGGSGDTLDYAKVPDDMRTRFDRFAKIDNSPALPKTGTITRADYRKEYAKKMEAMRAKFGDDGPPHQGLTAGIIGLCNKGQLRQPDDWGALRAWAWGASRALDYFETDKAVDGKKVAIEGLSRYGKAAIVTMAYDERFATGFVGSSGQGGAKIMRRDYGEKVENVASSGEYHWMAGNYLKYAGPKTPNDLPVDAHQLVAMCAPRPVLLSVGSEKVEGTWIDSRGTFLAGVKAGPVYKLLGKKDLGTDKFPDEKVALTDGELAYRQHEGGHTTGPNWPTFLDFAVRLYPLALSPQKAILTTTPAPRRAAKCLPTLPRTSATTPPPRTRGCAVPTSTRTACPSLWWRGVAHRIASSAGTTANSGTSPREALPTPPATPSHSWPATWTVTAAKNSTLCTPTTPIPTGSLTTTRPPAAGTTCSPAPPATPAWPVVPLWWIAAAPGGTGCLCPIRTARWVTTNWPPPAGW